MSDSNRAAEVIQPSRQTKDSDISLMTSTMLLAYMTIAGLIIALVTFSFTITYPAKSTLSLAELVIITIGAVPVPLGFALLIFGMLLICASFWILYTMIFELQMQEDEAFSSGSQLVRKLTQSAVNRYRNRIWFIKFSIFMLFIFLVIYFAMITKLIF